MMRAFPFRLLLAATAMASVVLPYGRALAEEAHRVEGHAVEAAAEHASRGLPQMDPSFYVGQVFWLVVCFLTFAMVVMWHVLPNVRATYRARQTLLDAEHEAARHDQAATEVLQRDYERSMADATSKADALLDSTMARMSAMLEQERDQAQERLEKRIFVAETAARVRLHDALARVEQEVESIAPLIVDHALRTHNANTNNTIDNVARAERAPSTAGEQP